MDGPPACESMGSVARGLTVRQVYLDRIDSED